MRERLFSPWQMTYKEGNGTVFAIDKKNLSRLQDRQKILYKMQDFS